MSVGPESSHRASYTAAAAQLRGSADGLARTGDDVLGVAALLEKQPRLRRALSDPARLGSERGELLGSLVAGKVSAEAEGALRALVDGRWSSGTELLTAVERLGVEAVLASADAAGNLADVEDELFRFGQTVDGDSALAAALGNTTAPLAGRQELAQSLLAGKARPATSRLVDLALRGFGGRNFAAGLSRLVELAAERRERQIAYVTVATALTDAEENRLAARLAGIYGRQVDLKVTVKPEILGGVSIQVGHDLYDGTVLRRITQARSALSGKA